ncbi:MAG: hypothetical protein AAGC97_03570 [Planctomycetota bacterium]
MPLSSSAAKQRPKSGGLTPPVEPTEANATPTPDPPDATTGSTPPAADATPATTEGKPELAPEAVAAKAIRAITGCGVAESDRRVAKLPGDVVAAIADAESKGNRQSVPGILADAARAEQQAKAAAASSQTEIGS